MPKATYIIVTVQPVHARHVDEYRLGFDIETSERYFKKPMTIFLSLDRETEFEIDINCGPPPRQSYDLRDARLDNWIHKNRFHCYPKSKPTKLIFSLTRRRGKTVLTHYKNEKTCT